MPATSGDGDSKVAQVRQLQIGANKTVRRRQPHDRRTLRQIEDPLEDLAVPRLDPGDRAPAKKRERGGHVARLAVAEPKRNRAGFDNRGPAPGAHPLAQPRRSGGEDFADGVVELAQAGEPGGEGDVGDADLGGLQQQPRGLGALSPSHCEWPGTELAGEEAGEVT